MTYREWKELAVLDRSRGVLWARAAALFADGSGALCLAAVQPLSWAEAPRIFPAGILLPAGGRLLSPDGRGTDGPPAGGTDLSLLIGCPILDSTGGLRGEAADFLLDTAAGCIAGICTRQGETLPVPCGTVFGRDAILLGSAGAPVSVDMPAPDMSPRHASSPSGLVTTYIDSGEQAVIPHPAERTPEEGLRPEAGTAIPPGLLGSRVLADVRDEAGRLIARRDDRVTEGMALQAVQAGRMGALQAAVRS